jgi:hypothetical protein
VARPNVGRDYKSRSHERNGKSSYCVLSFHIHFPRWLICVTAGPEETKNLAGQESSA